MFTVTNDFFPQYDDGNLYNTNPDFDFGAFKNLAERHQLMGTNSTLFPFRFEKAGVYVFKLNSAADLKMVGKSFCKTFIIIGVCLRLIFNAFVPNAPFLYPQKGFIGNKWVK